MTPKEKAEELVYKHLPFVAIDNKWDSEYLQKKDNAKKSALITINEMLDFRNALFINEGSLIHQHLLDVKSEIEKI
jgi:hypothetical protein